MPTYKLTILGICALFSLLAACGPMGDESRGSSGTSSDLAGGGIGGSGDGEDTTTLQVTLEGRQAPGLDALYITVAGIDLQRAGHSGWVKLPMEMQTIDVLQLVDGQQAVLFDALVESEVYDKVRFRLHSASVTVLGQTHETQVSNGQPIAQWMSDLNVSEGQPLDVRLDFDPLKSIQLVAQGTVMFSPTVSVVQSEWLASVSGVIVAPDLDPQYTNYARVVARDGTTGQVEAAAQVRVDGTYRIGRLPAFDLSGAPRSYTLEAVVPGIASLVFYSNVELVSGEDNEFDFLLEPATGTPDEGDWDWWNY